jgi:hypothetical protein
MRSLKMVIRFNKKYCAISFVGHLHVNKFDKFNEAFQSKRKKKEFRTSSLHHYSKLFIQLIIY